MPFVDATRKQARLRLALGGTAGTGKTYSAVWLASLFGDQVAVIDSERGSASLYAINPGEAPSPLDHIVAGKGRFRFRVSELEEKSPQEYLREIDLAAAEGYDVLVVDSFSHSWTGALEAVDRGGGWIKAGKTVSPLVAKLVNKILSYPGHVIVTFRVKAAYEVEKNERGQNTLKKVGLAPVARDQTDYEFTMWFDLDTNGMMSVGKTRCGDLPLGHVLERQKISELAQTLKSWLADGVPESPLDHWTGRIRFAADSAQLEAVGVELRGVLETGAVALSPEQKAAFRDAYLRRKQELSQADDGGPPA
jgi:hypothetical protein